MAKISIELDDNQLKDFKKIIAKNRSEDLDNETFSGVEIIVSITAFGHYLELKTDKNFEIGEVFVSY